MKTTSNVCRNVPITLLWLGLLVVATTPGIVSSQSIEEELDAYWDAVSESVEAGNFEAYSGLYHEDAVLVSGLSGDTKSIQQALSEWEGGFTDTREGRMKAQVAFKFTQRLHDADSAHETGLFNYRAEFPDGRISNQYVHFEALLVKKDRWKMVMEYQKSMASKEEWEAMD